MHLKVIFQVLHDPSKFLYFKFREKSLAWLWILRFWNVQQDFITLLLLVFHWHCFEFTIQSLVPLLGKKSNWLTGQCLRRWCVGTVFQISPFWNGAWVGMDTSSTNRKQEVKVDCVPASHHVMIPSRELMFFWWKYWPIWKMDVCWKMKDWNFMVKETADSTQMASQAHRKIVERSVSGMQCINNSIQRQNPHTGKIVQWNEERERVKERACVYDLSGHHFNEKMHYRTTWISQHNAMLAFTCVIIH